MLKMMIILILYCINVIDKSEDSANILFSCGERWENIRIEAKLGTKTLIRLQLPLTVNSFR